MVALAAMAVLALSAAGAASAVRVEVKGSAPEQFAGSDWVGKVTLLLSFDAGRRESGLALVAFSFANLCDRRGSALPDSVSVPINAKTRRFHYRGRGFVLSGDAIGSRNDITEITGLASVSTRGCHSGPWWFGVYPAR